MSSIHKHETSEVLLIESGQINCYIGKDLNSLEVIELNEGDTIFIENNEWHRIEFVKGNYQEDGIYFAQITELMFGENLGGKYPIQRSESAKKSKMV